MSMTIYNGVYSCDSWRDAIIRAGIVCRTLQTANKPTVRQENGRWVVR